MKQVSLTSLPLDMQELLRCFFEEAGLDEVPSQLLLREIPLACFPDASLADGLIDARGDAYARDMMQASRLPPIVVQGGSWLDGRHRVWASKQMGRLWCTAIDLEPYLGSAHSSLVIGDLISIGELEIQEQCALYADQYIDCSPEFIGAYGQPDDINHLQWLLCTLTREGMRKIGSDRSISGLNPNRSDLNRPIILSFDDENYPDGDMMLWDGHHRSASAWISGVQSIPMIFGLPKDSSVDEFHARMSAWIQPCHDASVIARIMQENSAYGSIFTDNLDYNFYSTREDYPVLINK